MQTNPKTLQEVEEPSTSDWRLRLLENMIISRESDIREDILFRQGRGQFHVSSSGHEAIAVFSEFMSADDWIFSHYRDKALMLARGVPLAEIALGYFAKAASSSSGRQMVSHFFEPSLNIAPSATPTGLQCLPSAGIAWGLKRLKTKNVVFCFIGDASTRQGEFFEAIAFAVQEKLPVIFVVEDNGYGISTPTERLTPLNLGLLPPHLLSVMDGRNPLTLAKDLEPLIQRSRSGGGPKIVWVKLDRLAPHTASDDHSRYRSCEDLNAMWKRDPLVILQNNLQQEGLISDISLRSMKETAKVSVKLAYASAEAAKAPDIGGTENSNCTIRPNTAPRYLSLSSADRNLGSSWTMSEAFNYTLNRLMREHENMLMFGEDIEDPKGGVFGLTKGLSSLYHGRVLNAPLAEATIAGIASGLANIGFLPVFELQFIDFVGPAFNQIVNQIATLRWRSANKVKLPLVLYAPCGGFVGGGPWHSQTNESWFAHAPGLKVYMPSNANDAAHSLYNAANGHDPVIILLPKNQFQKRDVVEKEPRIHHERARIFRSGRHVTIIGWGNCVSLSLSAADILAERKIEAEVIDLCSIVPCDWQTICSSIEKTGRLVVVQEDARTCSFGQAIISEICSNKKIWEGLHAPPQLVTREDTYIPFNRDIEKQILPNVFQIVKKAEVTLGLAHE